MTGGSMLLGVLATLFGTQLAVGLMGAGGALHDAGDSSALAARLAYSLSRWTAPQDRRE